MHIRAEKEPYHMAREYALQEATAPFDLTQGPLLRAKLLHVAEQQFVFLLNIHHIVCDEWSIEVASRLMRQGWQMAVKDLFYHPTIAELAPRLTQKATLEKQDIVTGKVPLTPIQRWFFENHSGELHHFNQAVLLRSKKRLDHNRLRTVLQKLQAHHDALRMTFQYKMDHTSGLLETDIVQQNAGLEHPFYFQVVDLKGNPDEIALLTSHAQSRQKAFDLQTGSLMQAVLYRLTDSDRLLVIIHHLVVDGVSWRILLEDIEQGYRQAEVGSQIDFGPKTASFKQWAQNIKI